MVGRRLWSDVAASLVWPVARAHGPGVDVISPILTHATDTMTDTPTVERPPDMGLAGHDTEPNPIV